MSSGPDLGPDDADLRLDADSEPTVGRAKDGAPPGLAVAVFALMAVGLFLALNARRTEAQAATLVTPAPQAVWGEPAPPLQLPIRPPEPVTAPPPEATPPSAVLPSPEPPAAPQPDPLQRRRAPMMIVDLAAGARPQPAVLASDTAPAGAATTLAQAPAARPDEGSFETLTSRLSQGAGPGPDRAVATAMPNLGLVVPQGAIIPAVLETAINTDLPGYTRAVVSRDVRSFDGTAVLIPRGSRLIGQYRSAVALGQSRAFIVWSRVTRPDGVSVQIGSPGTDELGRGGLTGEVDRHFFSRFAGSILMSVLNAGAAALVDGPTTQISIGSPGQAATLAADIQPGIIPPTIKVPQGESIRIFVARDLDFSRVGPMR